MTQDEIIRMAREAGAEGLVNSRDESDAEVGIRFIYTDGSLERFAALVAEATSDIKYEQGYEDGYAAALRSMK